MDNKLNLDVPAPEMVAQVLRAAAQSYWESQSELQSAWQDKSAGQPWGRIARILERAADKCEQVAGSHPTKE